MVVGAAAAVGCGGEGGGGTVSPPPTPPQPTIGLAWQNWADTARVDTLAVGDTVTRPATATASSGPVPAVSYTATGGLTTEASTGLVRATELGAGLVTASAGGRTVSWKALVVPRVATTQFASTTVVVAGDAQAGLVARDSAGSAIGLVSAAGAPLAPGLGAGLPVTYATSNPGVAVVTATGLIRGVTAGEATITAVVTNGRRQISVPGRVAVEVVRTGGFRMDVRFVGQVDDRVRALVAKGAADWERVIVRGGTPQRIVLAAGTCGQGTPALDETVQTIIVYVAVDPSGGANGFLARGGPCSVRAETVSPPPNPQVRFGLPAVGSMTLNPTTLPTLLENGQAYDVIRHELGHVLGIGAMWSGFGRNVVTGGFEYTGPLASQASSELGFTAFGSPALVESTGGPGVAGSHWRESVYGADIMTPYLRVGTNPISRLSVAGLADLGYEVQLGAAEALPPGGAAGGAPAGSPALSTRAAQPVRLTEDVLRPAPLRPLRDDAPARVPGSTRDRRR